MEEHSNIYRSREDLNNVEKNILTENSEITENKKKRRKKNILDGRNFVCHCGRAYLSQPALNNHMKIKHLDNKNFEIENQTLNKKRGRPKKGTYIALNEKIFREFFKTVDRRIISKEDLISNRDFKILLEEVFAEIFYSKKYYFESNYNDLEQNNLANILMNKISNNQTKFNDVNKQNLNSYIDEKVNQSISDQESNEIKEKEQIFNELFYKNSEKLNENKFDELKKDDYDENTIKQPIKKKLKRIKKNSDLIMSEYIDYCKNNCNRNHIKIILMFVFLFRELINKIKKNDYSSKIRPTKVLELSNDFFPFLFQVKILDNIDDKIKIYFVENLIHFSCWLYKNLYTSSKICLIFPKIGNSTDCKEKNKEKFNFVENLSAN